MTSGIEDTQQRKDSADSARGVLPLSPFCRVGGGHDEGLTSG